MPTLSSSPVLPSFLLSWSTSAWFHSRYVYFICPLHKVATVRDSFTVTIMSSIISQSRLVWVCFSTTVWRIVFGFVLEALAFGPSLEYGASRQIPCRPCETIHLPLLSFSSFGSFRPTNL
jgi:hypothetical protein